MAKRINDFPLISDLTNKVILFGDTLLNKIISVTPAALLSFFQTFFYTKGEVDNRVASNLAGTADTLSFNPGTPVTNLIYRANAGAGTYTNFKRIKTGTITTTSGSAAVVGVGTKFLTELAAGVTVYSGATLLGTVLSVTDDTHATLSAPTAAVVAGVVYNGPVVVSASDGQVDFLFNTTTGFWAKVASPQDLTNYYTKTAIDTTLEPQKNAMGAFFDDPYFEPSGTNLYFKPLWRGIDPTNDVVFYIRSGFYADYSCTYQKIIDDIAPGGVPPTGFLVGATSTDGVLNCIRINTTYAIYFDPVAKVFSGRPIAKRLGLINVVANWYGRTLANSTTESPTMAARLQANILGKRLVDNIYFNNTSDTSIYLEETKVSTGAIYFQASDGATLTARGLSPFSDITTWAALKTRFLADDSGFLFVTSPGGVDCLQLNNGTCAVFNYETSKFQYIAHAAVKQWHYVLLHCHNGRLSILTRDRNVVRKSTEQTITAQLATYATKAQTAQTDTRVDAVSKNSTLGYIDYAQNLILGAYINPSTGVAFTAGATDYQRTDFIPVKPGQVLYFTFTGLSSGGGAGCAGYSAATEASYVTAILNNTATSRTAYDELQYVVPNGVNYIRASSCYQNTAAVTINGGVRTLSITDKLKNTSLPRQLFEETKNIFNPDLALYNKIFNGTIGAFDDSTGRAVIGYQPVLGDRSIIITGISQFVVGFNASMQIIWSTTTMTYDAPTGTATIAKLPPDVAFVSANSRTTYANINLFTDWRRSIKITQKAIVSNISYDTLPTKASQAIDNAIAAQTEETNHFNPSLALFNKKYDGNTLAFVDSPGRATYGLQPVTAGKSIKMTGVTNDVFFFDAGGVFIIYSNTYPYDANTETTTIDEVPKNVAFVTANSSVTLNTSTNAYYQNWLNGCKILMQDKVTSRIALSALPPGIKESIANLPLTDKAITFYNGSHIYLKPKKGAYITERFRIPRANIQSVAYNRGKLYAGYDIGGGNTKIIVFDYVTGTILKTVASIAAGHASDMDYDSRTGILYVCNYNTDAIGNGKIFTIDIESATPTVTGNYDIESLSAGGGQCSLDEENNKIYTQAIVGSTIQITPIDITSKVNDMANQFTVTLDDPSPLQGSVFNDGKLYILQGTTSTRIIVVDLTTKAIINTIAIATTAEPEGLAIINDTPFPYFVLGYGNAGILYNLYLI